MPWAGGSNDPAGDVEFGGGYTVYLTLAILVAAIIAVVGAGVAVWYSRMLASEEKQVDAPAKPTIASLIQTEVFLFRPRLPLAMW